MSGPLRLFILRQEGHLRNLQGFLGANWKAMADQGRPLSVMVTEHKAKRSSEQNRRLWALLNDIAANAWIEGKQFSADAWHEHFKRTLIGSEELPSGGSVGISTTTLDVGEFSSYMDKIEAYAATELGLELAA